MYTSKIVNVELDEEAILARITVEYYKDGVLVDTQVHRTGELKTLAGIAQQQINEYQRRDILVDYIAKPPIGESPIPSPVELTQDQLNARAFQQKRQALVQAKQDLDLGLIEQSEFDSVQADVIQVKSTLKPVTITPTVLQ